jgi:hypothetical protein
MAFAGHNTRVSRDIYVFQPILRYYSKPSVLGNSTVLREVCRVLESFLHHQEQASPGALPGPDYIGCPGKWH